MFERDAATGNITMHRGDTGAFVVRAVRKTGAEWSADDRMLFTVTNANREIVLQRIYRLDTALGNGRCLIQFHNGDTDSWENGTYSAEWRYIGRACWEGTPTVGDCENALTADGKIVDGVPTRVPKDRGQFTITIEDVYGEV